MIVPFKLVTVTWSTSMKEFFIDSKFIEVEEVFNLRTSPVLFRNCALERKKLSYKSDKVAKTYLKLTKCIDLY